MKRILKRLLLTFVLSMTLFTSVIINRSCTKVSAATTPNYTVAFSYENYYKVNLQASLVGSSVNTTKASVMYGQGGTTTLSISMYGSGKSGTSTFYSGDYIMSDVVNINVSSSHDSTNIFITDSSGNSVASSGTNTITASGLSDGTYYVEVSCQSPGWSPNAREYRCYYTECEFSFVVDTNPPKITGATTSKTNYKNSSFTVSASDIASGVKNLYIKNPNGTGFTACPNPCEITNGVNGLYSFYAIDNVGNSTPTHYVYFDGTSPTGKVTNSSGTVITSSYVNTQFYYSATDSESGLYELQWKTPTSSSWQTYDTNVLTILADNGNYYFRARDNAGNFSSTKSIYFDNKVPTMSFYNENGSVKDGSIVNSEYISYTANGTGSGVKNSYVKMPGNTNYSLASEATQYLASGTYSFYCVDNAGNRSSTYTVTLDNEAPTLTATNATFGTTTEFEFRVTAEDDSVCEIFYKGPNDLDYRVSSYNYVDITYDMPEGRYYFYAEDQFGNRSSEKYIDFYQPAPEILITYDETTNHYMLTWFDSTYTVGVNGMEYFSGGMLAEEGDYEILVIANNGKTNTYNISIDHKWVITGWVEATCLAEGYSINECLTCDVIIHGNWTGIGDHKYVEDDVIPPTCDEKGYTLTHCVYCGGERKTNYVDELEHEFYVAGKVDATCQSEGYTINKCRNCDVVINGEWTGIGDHIYVADKVVEPTCSEKGYTMYHCDYCLTQWKGDYVDELEHEFYVAGKVDATCQSEGYTINKCKNCDVVINGNWTGIGDHLYIADQVIEPTCEEEGYTMYHCDYCLTQWKGSYVDELGHQFEVVGKVDATCLAEGYTINKCKNCGVIINGEWTGIGDHLYIADKVIEPTCEEEGYTMYHCDYCLTQWKGSYVDELGHQFEVVGKVDATCLAEGYTINKCKNCDVVINGNWTGIGDHSYLVKEVVEATCSSKGYTLYFCDVCFCERISDYIDTTPHNYEKTHVEANCMNKGYIHYKCIDCGYSYDDDFTDPISHDYEITNKVGSCEEEGSITYKCNVCGYTYTENLGFGSHSYLTTITNPTCTTQGFTKYECSSCGKIYYDNYISPLGHNYSKIVIDATCTTNGYTEYECSNCGDSYQTNQVPAIGHKYIETNREPTCTKSGGTFYSCMFCSSEYQTNEILPVGHAYETEILKVSDCINEGKRRYYCPKCGDEYEIIIPATGHNYQLLNENNKNGVVERTYKCNDCGDNYSEALGDQYDKVATYVIDLVNKYNPYIVYVFTATAGLWSIGMGVAYAVAQKNEDKVKTKKMLVNYIIGIVAIFVILVALPYLVKGIAILLS